MGWAVIGFGYIEVDNNHIKEILDLMIGDDKKRVTDRLEGNDDGCDFRKVEEYDKEITFEMGGNKGIDYSELDKIKEYCKKNKIKVNISVSEYIEASDGGYWFNSEEE